MSLLILDRDAVAQALPMHECIEVMATALADLRAVATGCFRGAPCAARAHPR